MGRVKNALTFDVNLSTKCRIRLTPSRASLHFLHVYQHVDSEKLKRKATDRSLCPISRCKRDTKGLSVALVCHEKQTVLDMPGLRGRASWIG